MDAEALGIVALGLGAGRRTKDDKIDHGAGIILHKKTGDKVACGDVIATLYTNRQNELEGAKKAFLAAISLSDAEVQRSGLIYKVIR